MLFVGFAAVIAQKDRVSLPSNELHYPPAGSSVGRAVLGVTFCFCLIVRCSRMLQGTTSRLHVRGKNKRHRFIVPRQTVSLLSLPARHRDRKTVHAAMADKTFTLNNGQKIPALGLG